MSDPQNRAEVSFGACSKLLPQFLLNFSDTIENISKLSEQWLVQVQSNPDE